MPLASVQVVKRCAQPLHIRRRRTDPLSSGRVVMIRAVAVHFGQRTICIALVLVVKIR